MVLLIYMAAQYSAIGKTNALAMRIELLGWIDELHNF
jgi:hypothetical protein